METLEQYGIKDVTPGKSVGSSERLRAVKGEREGIYRLYVQERFVGLVYDAVLSDMISDGDVLLNMDVSALWVDKEILNQ